MRPRSLTEEIDYLERAISSGETSTTVDGTTTVVDIDAMRIRLLELQRKYKYMRLRRPILSSINLSKAMG